MNSTREKSGKLWTIVAHESGKTSAAELTGLLPVLAPIAVHTSRGSPPSSPTVAGARCPEPELYRFRRVVSAIYIKEASNGLE